MARTESTMLELGTAAPDFTLPDTISGAELSLDDIAGEKGTLIMFICNHCPFVKHVVDELVRIGNDYQPKGVGIAAISANDVTTHPDDHPDRMAELAREKKFPFPYLFDESQEVARAFQAACTPDFFLFDADRRLVYRGQLDDARPGNDAPVDGRNLRAALDALIEGRQIDPDQKPSVGCNIKWKAAA